MLDHLRPKINPESLPKLVKLARLEVFEPFAGEQNMERLQKARTSLEAGMEKATRKAGDWIEESGVVGKAQGHLADLKQKIPWGKKKPEAEQEASPEASKESKSLQVISKEKFSELQSKLWQGAKAYAFKGFDLLWKEDPESWILPKASKVLGRELQQLDELQEVTEEERAALLKQLYPYNSTNVQKLAKGFEVSVNLSLGVLVATNLPGTGLLVSGINTVKTIVKIASGVQVLAALYGYRMQSQEALFTLCGKIIASMEDFETNPDHLPLSYKVLEPLFRASEGGEDKNLETLLAEALKKEAYIAIPGVGMLSLGKIQLDNYKAEQIILSLMEKRRIYLEVSATMEQNLLLQEAQNLRDVFYKLRDLNAPAMLKVYLHNRKQAQPGQQGWLEKWKRQGQPKKTELLLWEALEVVAQNYYQQVLQKERELAGLPNLNIHDLQDLFSSFEKDTAGR